MQSKYVFKALLIILVALTVACRGQGATQVAKFSDRAQTLRASITVANWNAHKGKNPRFITLL